MNQLDTIPTGERQGASSSLALSDNHSTAIGQTRAAQEVQASMVIAKKFPRDENVAYEKIMRSCDRLGLAETAIYSYPRGGQQVTGASIHLAKAIAKSWGNLDFGIREVEQGDGYSIVETYCWDLESNARETKVFKVMHERHTRKSVTSLSDPRDIYEMVANQGSRRLRACILGIIPEDIVESAKERCYATLKKGGGNKPLKDRVREMVAYFGGIGVDKKLLEKRLGHNLDSIDETELVNLRMIANSLKNGAAKREDYFDLDGPEGGHAQSLNDEISAKVASKKDAKQPEQTQEPKS